MSSIRLKSIDFGFLNSKRTVIYLFKNVPEYILEKRKDGTTNGRILVNSIGDKKFFGSSSVPKSFRFRTA
ncbi:hypothetical protein DLM78_22940 [Leptospira stimsonii]|uniref:Uncharacterized protein n=1 Tax=Leptospira stimsonii TaxID=2202203 RepID=A0A8B3CMB1_9LEPT|nr:hypothetical protein DLM78_22940 [Leptospira stimsonii]